MPVVNGNMVPPQGGQDPAFIGPPVDPMRSGATLLSDPRLPSPWKIGPPLPYDWWILRTPTGIHWFDSEAAVRSSADVFEEGRRDAQNPFPIPSRNPYGLMPPLLAPPGFPRPQIF